MNDKQLDEKLGVIREKFPQVAGRYEKGVAIYKANHLQKLEGDETRIVVPSQTKPDVAHMVKIDTTRATCSCQDYQRNAPEVKGQKLCKHLIAVFLWSKNGLYEAQS